MPEPRDGLLAGARLASPDLEPPVEPLPDLASLSDDELRNLIEALRREEHEVSYRRRILHGKIDILRAELVARLQRQVGEEGALRDVDVAKLTEVLTGKATPATEGGVR